MSRLQPRSHHKTKSPTMWVGQSVWNGSSIFGSPNWARTSDLRINSPALRSLCQFNTRHILCNQRIFNRNQMIDENFQYCGARLIFNFKPNNLGGWPKTTDNSSKSASRVTMTKSLFLAVYQISLSDADSIPSKTTWEVPGYAFCKKGTSRRDKFSSNNNFIERPKNKCDALDLQQKREQRECRPTQALGNHQVFPAVSYLRIAWIEHHRP